MQIFPAWSNALSKIIFAGLLLALPAVAAVAMIAVRSDFFTGKRYAREQPVQFSHQHHVGRLGLDCRYCHGGAETAAFAGIPATDVCMTCHSQVWKDSPMLEPVRRSLESGQPLRWLRVNRVPDYVYFDHSIHVRQGVGCVVCHGRVDRMALTYPEHAFQMQWCLQCHREPADFLRPREYVFSMDWKPDEPQRQLGQRLLAQYGIAVPQLDDCTICHR